MEESFGLHWEDSSAVVQGEEVICGIESDILPGETAEFSEVAEEVVEETPQNGEEIMYLNEGQVVVMQPGQMDPAYQEYMEVSEEVVTDQWGESCPEEIVVGSEEAVGGPEGQAPEDCDVPLPDQDEYTAARPYPCDFCSRRFRKKANLMNHMVAHQTDRPHGCNLCGVRYIRKCDLMNHLKIHAYIPEADGLEEDEQTLEDSDGGDRIKKRNKSFQKKRKRPQRVIKEELDEDAYEAEEGGVAGSSRQHYNYVDEDMRLMEQMENTKNEYDSRGGEYLGGGEEEHDDVDEEEEEIRYEITDPRKPFVCQHCGVGFAREKALASHARIHGGDSPFECQKCGDMFWDAALMKEHMRTKHGDVDDFDDDEDEDYSDEDTKYGTFYCSTCGLSFHRQDNLRRHQRVHIKEEYVNEHEFGHICNVCGESFQEALDLLAHAEIHARGSEHRCMICGELCADEDAVQDHVQNKHGKSLPPNTCLLCGRTCKDRRTLLKHSWEHSKEKMFACSKCAKTFHNKARLKRHMLSHRNKVVPCDVCGEEFPDGRTLMNHRHSHSSVSGRQFPCRECGKTFGSRSSQQIHIRIHTGERPYGCRFCWKAFADGGTLRKHERIHTGEKPYACAVCPRAFNQRVVLREHIRSHHSGPDPKYSHSMTPFCCSVCSDMFATSQDLILHLIHHCDMNTAMKRQPQVGPRKYKRRRKLKPHELEMISNRNVEEEIVMEEEEQTLMTESDEEREQRKKMPQRKPRKASSSSSPRPSISETYADVYANAGAAPAQLTPTKKKSNKPEPALPSRPKMIHTQKTRIAVETGEDGKVRHKTKTLVTRTQPTELKSATGERIRPRTKNVSYHVYNADKLPLATFPDDEDEDDDDTERAVSNLLREENLDNGDEPGDGGGGGGLVYMDQVDQPQEIAAEQTVESEGPVPVGLVKINKVPRRSGRPTRHILGPGSKVRIVKGGMIVSKTKNKRHLQQQQPLQQPEEEPESILPDVGPPAMVIKQEMIEASPLHELAEISMQHAQNLFKCEMCSEVFSDRAQLLVHVPVHI
ncbi:unnamed protein product [Brassicogethes aeneus]|uniref:C2H2-type domain-containing protein n=1 Tax=Brassicogethes aeneus TaxID=1431903 RepID=A0A9P0FH22_BRAAE|nr:unnamed protein product [Brassicogethes aeneus]